MARATRRLVLQRDGYRCTSCGATEHLEVHHIVPRAEGGTNQPENLVTLCMACHGTAHDRRSPETGETRCSEEPPNPADDDVVRVDVTDL